MDRLLRIREGQLVEPARSQNGQWHTVEEMHMSRLGRVLFIGRLMGRRLRGYLRTARRALPAAS